SRQRPLGASNGRHRNGVLNYLIGAAGIGLASVAAKSQVATNRRWLAQEALPRAWTIDSLASESRSALRHLRRGAAGCGHIYWRPRRPRRCSRPCRLTRKCDLAAQSRLANFQHCHQLEPGGGADQYRDLRRVEYNLNIIPTLHNNVDRNA